LTGKKSLSGTRFWDNGTGISSSKSLPAFCIFNKTHSMTSPAVKSMSVAEYLELEDASLEKHEYIDGEVLAMAGASFAHNQIAANAQGSIWQFLSDKPCRIYGSDLKVAAKTASSLV
jgi:hypothetical protein